MNHTRKYITAERKRFAKNSNTIQNNIVRNTIAVADNSKQPIVIILPKRGK